MVLEWLGLLGLFGSQRPTRRSYVAGPLFVESAKNVFDHAAEVSSPEHLLSGGQIVFYYSLRESTFDLLRHVNNLLCVESPLNLRDSALQFNLVCRKPNGV